MKYVCKICGYVYDDEKQQIPFADLPDTWKCPLCGASKSDFEPVGQPQEAKRPKTAVKLDADMQKLSAGQLAALCSNLARGCEKQYQQEASELFSQLAGYFTDVSPVEEGAETSAIAGLITEDLENGYPTVQSVAGDRQDRGALRVCVWGEKVTRILKMLLERYESEGETFLENTEIWVCTTCGFVYVGDKAPELCPVCKVPDWKFEKVERGMQA